jgi:hypothetical protein
MFGPCRLPLCSYRNLVLVCREDSYVSMNELLLALLQETYHLHYISWLIVFSILARLLEWAFQAQKLSPCYAESITLQTRLMPSTLF